jgi:glycosyltransferase involved in cell wall biosynthesis
MHVAVDGRALRAGAARARGIARYLRCLLDALRREFPDDCYEIVDPGRLRLGTAAVVRRPRLDRLASGCDVFWAPSPAPLAVSSGTPVVLTAHDLSFDLHPRDYSAYDRVWQRLARPGQLARRANAVICVSEVTRRHAVEEWRVAPDRARTVLSGPGRPAAVSPPPDGSAVPPALPDLPEPFLLAVGALEPRKLPRLLAEGHRLARDRGLRAGLVFAGDGPLRTDLERAGATVLGHVPDRLLDVLYERALAVACVSRDEGFGFTPLEAAARGTPAIVADIPVFGETLGEAALRVPPGDALALAAALLRLEREPELRDSLAGAGREAAGRLSWEQTAHATRAVLAEAAG